MFLQLLYACFMVFCSSIYYTPETASFQSREQHLEKNIHFMHKKELMVFVFQ